MSSHHIIRDEQEPALILADLDAFPFDLLGQLLEWAPYTICGEAALDQALKYGINLDVVVSPRQDLDVLLGHFPSVQTFDFEDAWIEESMRHLIQREHKAVNVVTGDPFRDIALMYKLSKWILVDVITPAAKYVHVNKEFKKWMPLGAELINIESKNLVINDAPFTGPSYVIKKEGTFTVSSQDASFILGLSL
jgi:thiamine pyrophosphokinase